MSEPEKAICTRCDQEYEKDPSQGNFPMPAGIPKIDLCRDCYLYFREEPVEEEKPASEMDGSAALEAMEKIGVNVRRHGRLMLKDFEAPIRKRAEKFVKDLMAAGRYGEVKGLYVGGSTGTGKSQLAVSVIHTLLRTGTLRAQDIVYDSARRMVTQLQDRYRTGAVDEFSKVRRKARLWVYEDAGTEKLTDDAFRVVETIFDAREGHPTIVTSNLSRQQLAERWSAQDVIGRFKSRLREYVPIVMDGPDHRAG